MQLISRKQLLLAATTLITPDIFDQQNPIPSVLSSSSSATIPILSADEWKIWSHNVRKSTLDYLENNDVGSNGVTPGALIRLAFHDAVTGTPNGSIAYELAWSENRALQRPLEVVESIYENSQQQQQLTKVGSLADTIALVATQAIAYTGGPDIAIRLGRPDANEADAYLLERPLSRQTPRSVVTKSMPDAGLDSDGLRVYFGERLGIPEAEWVALCGIHGLGRHVSLLGMDKSCLRQLTRECLENAPVLLPFVTESVDRFSNQYFQALLLWNARQVSLGQVAFIPTDVALVVDTGLKWHVQKFASNEALYRRTFARGWQRLVESTATTHQRY